MDLHGVVADEAGITQESDIDRDTIIAQRSGEGASMERAEERERESERAREGERERDLHSVVADEARQGGVTRHEQREHDKHTCSRLQPVSIFLDGRQQNK